MVNYYDSIASGYDELYGREQLEKLDLIWKNIDCLKLKNIKLILDVGCGSGISTNYFYEKYHCKAKGIDPSKKLISIANNNYPKIKFVVDSAENMKFKETFDLVVSLTAIQNFDNIEKGLENIKKCAKKFILTFLKKSPKRKAIEKQIKDKFKIIKKLEQEKDVIYLCE